MYHVDARLAKIMMTMKLEQARNDSGFWEQQTQIFSQRPSWISAQASSLVRQVGHGLATLGRRMEQRSTL